MMCVTDMGSGAAPYSPADIFTGGFDGIWFDFSDTSKMWQNTSKTTPVTADTHPIRIMIDKGPNAYEFDAPTDALRPIYKSGSGLHWVQLATMVLRHASINALSSKTAFTKIMALEFISVSGNNVGDSWPPGAPMVQNNTSAFNFYAGSGIYGTKVSGTMVINTKYVISVVFNGSLTATHAARLKVYINDVSQTFNSTTGTINSTTAATTGAFVFANDAGGTVGLNARVYQYIAVNKAMSDPDRQAAQTYVGAKMGIVV